MIDIMASDIFGLGLQDKDRVANSLGGGLPKRSVVLIEGDSGSGKSVWLQRFTKGISEQGSTVTYVSEEENARSFINQMASLSYDIQDSLVRQRVLFLNSRVSRTERIDKPIRDLFTSDTIREGSEVIMVDNFDSLVLNDQEFEEGISDGRGDRVMQDLGNEFNELTNRGKTVVVAVDPTYMDQGVMRALRGLSTVRMVLDENVVGGDVVKTAQVKQYKNMPGSVEDRIGFSVGSGRGLSIESRNIA